MTCYYKDWCLELDRKPIPIRKFDWNVQHKNFDEDPGCDDRYFNAESLEDAMQEIDDWDDNH